MNYLLWGDDADLTDREEQDDVSTLSIKSLGDGHILDVALLSKSKAGHIVSVGLDRVVRVWDIRGRGNSYVVADGNDAEMCPFPILGLSIDDTSTWLALLSPSRISFWNLAKHRWIRPVPLENCLQRPAALFFDPISSTNNPSIILVHYDGTLVQTTADTGIASHGTPISSESLTLARVLTKKSK
jgi:WD40 repeat protein